MEFLGLIQYVLRGVFAPFRAWQRRTRRVPLEGLAAKQGWVVRASQRELVLPLGLHHRSPDATVQKIDDRVWFLNAYNVVQGEDRGRAFVAFEADWVRGDEDWNSRQRRQVLVVTLPGVAPTLWLSGRLWDDLGPRVRVESEQFNHDWQARALDERSAHAMLTPSVIDLLNTLPARHREFRFQDHILVQVRDGVFRAENLPGMLAESHALIERVPRFVWRGAP